MVLKKIKKLIIKKRRKRLTSEEIISQIQRVKITHVGYSKVQDASGKGRERLGSGWVIWREVVEREEDEEKKEGYKYVRRERIYQLSELDTFFISPPRSTAADFPAIKENDFLFLLSDRSYLGLVCRVLGEQAFGNEEEVRRKGILPRVPRAYKVTPVSPLRRVQDRNHFRIPYHKKGQVIDKADPVFALNFIELNASIQGITKQDLEQRIILGAGLVNEDTKGFSSSEEAVETFYNLISIQHPINLARVIKVFGGSGRKSRIKTINMGNHELLERSNQYPSYIRIKTNREDPRELIRILEGENILQANKLKAREHFKLLPQNLILLSFQDENHNHYVIPCDVTDYGIGIDYPKKKEQLVHLRPIQRERSFGFRQLGHQVPLLDISIHGGRIALGKTQAQTKEALEKILMQEINNMDTNEITRSLQGCSFVLNLFPYCRFNEVKIGLPTNAPDEEVPHREYREKIVRRLQNDIEKAEPDLPYRVTVIAKVMKVFADKDVIKGLGLKFTYQPLEHTFIPDNLAYEGWSAISDTNENPYLIRISKGLERLSRILASSVRYGEI